MHDDGDDDNDVYEIYGHSATMDIRSLVRSAPAVC
jgi:hypothetical protein